MTHPLLQRLLDQGFSLLDESGFERHVQAQPYSVLFFAEDPKRFPETLDVAVILPELLKVFPQLSPALIAPSLERTLQARYGFSAWPTLVFLREGRFLGCLSRMLNWDEYLQQVAALLASETQDDAGRIPVLDLSASAGTCSREEHV